MKPASLVAAFAAVVFSMPVQAQLCGEVEQLPWFQVQDASDNCEVVVGDQNLVAVTWTASGGFTSLGILPLPGHTRSSAYGVNGDGSVIVGISLDPGVEGRAFRWTSTGGLQDLGVLPGYEISSAVDVSRDGQVVVGNLSNSGVLPWMAFRWTPATGMQAIGSLTATRVSADGVVVVGHRYGPSGPRAIRWTQATGEQDIGTLGGATATPYGVSADGEVVVGVSRTAMGADHAFRWSAPGGMQDLGTLGGASSYAFDVSGDGRTVIGNASPGPGPNRAFRWSASGGMQDLGIGIGGFSEGVAVSFDGTTVVGMDYTIQRAFRYTVSQLGAPFCANAIANSTGCVGRVRASGSNVVSTNMFTLSVEYLSLNSFGFFITSRDQGSTYPVNNSQGRLCLGGFIGRFVGPGQIRNSGMTGTFSLAIDLTAMPTPFGSVAVQPGDAWHFQAWHRDANPTLTSNFTDAVSVTFQ
jgi:probable HAF family extracellular repeat protein